MADIENEKPKRRKKHAQNETHDATQAESSDDRANDMSDDINNDSADTFVQKNLKDLVSSATQALGGLFDDEPVAEATAAGAIDLNAGAVDLNVVVNAEATSLAESEMSDEQISAASEAAADTVAWNAASSELAFIDADGAESEIAMDADQAMVDSMTADGASMSDNELEAGASTEAQAEVGERSERLQNLARLVAKTVSERKAEIGEIHSEDAVEAVAIEPEPEQMGFEALEEELDAAENDADPEPTEFVDNDALISIIESLLFSTDKPVSTATIKTLFKGTNIRTKDIERALGILASEYASATRGVTLEEINGGFQLRTKVDNADFLKRLQKARPFRLSGPALETMAIIAYKQPVTKYEIDEIRGVESGHLIRALMERGMVQFQGKAEDKPGKPMAYGSTRKFLETFGLRNLRELPTLSEIDELIPEGIGEVEEKEKLSDITDELSNDFAGGYSDNEEELSKINDTLQAIDTTSEFFEQEKQRERERRDRDKAQDLRERIVLGEDVETKDKRWLDRYEAKLHADSQPNESGTPSTISADEIAMVEPIGDQLESLTNEGGTTGEALHANAREDHAELSKVDSELAEDSEADDEEAGELDGNIDWDDDEADEADVDTSNDV